jgi:hypothetical protein
MFAKQCGEFLFQYVWLHQQRNNGRLSKKILESLQIFLTTGAKDGKHVGVIVPADSGSLFYNFKNYFSVVLLGVCDSKYCFTFVDISSYDKSLDLSVLKTLLWKKLHTNILNLISGNALLSTERSTLPNVFIGVEAFKLTSSLLHPFGGKN